MTAISSDDIEFLLSGGSNNSDPNKSIGGEISSFPVLGSLNNLFPDITSEEAASGKVDYRCFYVKNSSSAGFLYDASMIITSQSSGGAYANLGLARSTDVQRIDVTGTSISGTMVLRLGETPISMNWGSSPFGFAASLRNALSYVGVNAQVDYSVAGNKTSFVVTFSGDSNYKSWPTLQVQENNLTGTDTPVVSIVKVTQGQPINSSAPLLTTDSMAPATVTFQNGTIPIGNLAPGTFAPIWVRRTTPANTEFSQNDGFTIKISGKPFVLTSGSSSSSSSSSGISIFYSTQPTQTFYQQVFSNAEIRISAQVVITGSSINSPLVTWEFSDDDGTTWIGVINTVSMSTNTSSASPGIIDETLILVGVGPSWNGRKFRVTNGEGSVSATSNVFTLDLGFLWTTHPSNSPWIGPVGAKYSDFSYAYNYLATQALTGGAFQYSDDGNIWQDFTPSFVTLFDSMPNPLTGLATKGGSFRVNTFAPSRRYRVKASISGVNYYSNHAFSVCPPSECSQFWPAGWSEPTYYADCGLVQEPGFNQYMDCNTCECAKVAISASSSSSIDCIGSGFFYSTASCADYGISYDYCNYNQYYANGCLKSVGCGAVVNGNCIPLSEYIAMLSSSSI